MEIEVLTDVEPDLFRVGSSGQGELCRQLEKHPQVQKYRSLSPYGSPHITKLDNSDLYCWCKPIAGGYWGYRDDVAFRVVRTCKKS